MVVVDLNLLIYAHDVRAASHVPALAWWEELVRSKRPVGLAWVTVIGFLRIVTNPRSTAQPLSVEAAVELVEGWLALPSVRVIEPGPKHAALLLKLIREAGVAGNLTTDAHLAALAMERGAEVASADADFGRFAGLRWVNPLG